MSYAVRLTREEWFHGDCGDGLWVGKWFYPFMVDCPLGCDEGYINHGEHGTETCQCVQDGWRIGDKVRNPTLEWRWIESHDRERVERLSSSDVYCKGSMLSDDDPYHDQCRWAAVGVKKERTHVTDPMFAKTANNVVEVSE